MSYNAYLFLKTRNITPIDLTFMLCFKKKAVQKTRTPFLAWRYHNNNNNNKAPSSGMTSPTLQRDLTSNRKDAGLSPIILYISGFLDLFGVSMIIPLVLAHSRSLGYSPTITGILGSTYGAIQLFSSPLIGSWSDIKGRQFTLLVCLFMTGFGYSIFSISKTISLMFVARIPLGIFKHSQSISKAYLAEITPKSDQASVMGNFNSASSLGFILGPAVGGNIAERPQGFYLVALLTTFIFFFNGIIIWLFRAKVKTSNPVRSEDTPQHGHQSADITFSLTEFWHSLKHVDWSDLWDLYLTKIVLGIAMLIFWSNFSLVLIHRFNTSPATNGYVISFKSMFSVLSGFVTGKVSKTYSNNAKLLLHLSCLQSFTLLGLALSPSLWLFVSWLIPLAFITSIARVAGTSLSMDRSKNTDIGLLLGFQQSCMSIARMLAPLIAGIAMEIGPSVPALVGSFLSLVGFIIMVIRPQDPRERMKKIQ